MPVARGFRPPHCGTSAAAAPDAGRGVCAVVTDAEGREKLVPLDVTDGRPLSTHLRQTHDNQGRVTLRLTYDGHPLAEVCIELPSRPRGEKVWVWLELHAPAGLEVVLEHEQSRVQAFIELPAGGGHRNPTAVSD